jgi:hypothetical protein
MPTIQESLDALVTQTTGLTNTVSGRITDMDGKITQANSAQVAAETAKTNAEIAETSAQTAQSLAETARDVASTAKVDAQTAKSDALAAQSAASAAQTSAEAARDASIAADVSASTNRSDSITAKNASVVAQGLSETAEVNAAASAAAANSHKTKAGQWADNAEDASVETGKYSAKHWSAKAAIENTAAGVSANNASASATSAASSEGVATTKASESSASASASASSASTATTKASEASASANTAATQAGISTTKASEASSSASAAASSASSASSAATTAVNAVIDTAPANLNTLNELAAALGDDANYASTTTAALGNRYTKAETDAKVVELSPPATKAHIDSLAVNAGTLDGIDSSQFLRSDVSDTTTQRTIFKACETNNWDTIATAGGSQGAFEVLNTGAGNDAFMTFHASGDYAGYFGLDADTNDLAWGGWSVGAVKHKIWHDGNTAGTVLQVVSYRNDPNNDTYVSISSGVHYSTAVAVTITPKSSNSTLYIKAVHQVRSNDGVGMTAGLLEDGVGEVDGSINNNSLDFFYKSTSLNHHINMRVERTVASVSTIARTFRMWVAPYGGEGEANNGWGNRYIEIMEVSN